MLDIYPEKSYTMKNAQKDYICVLNCIARLSQLRVRFVKDVTYFEISKKLTLYRRENQTIHECVCTSSPGASTRSLSCTCHTGQMYETVS